MTCKLMTLVVGKELDSAQADDRASSFLSVQLLSHFLNVQFRSQLQLIFFKIIFCILMLNNLSEFFLSLIAIKWVILLSTFYRWRNRFKGDQ